MAHNIEIRSFVVRYRRISCQGRDPSFAQNDLTRPQFSCDGSLSPAAFVWYFKERITVKACQPKANQLSKAKVSGLKQSPNQGPKTPK